MDDQNRWIPTGISPIKTKHIIRTLMLRKRNQNTIRKLLTKHPRPELSNPLDF